MDVLYVFVEGSDDERFFRFYFSTENVKIIQYARMTHKDFTKFLHSISHMKNADYIIIADADGASIDAKKEKVSEKHPVCDTSKVFISQHEIESWYIAGLNSNDSAKYKVKYINCTDSISKEKFETLIPKNFSPVSFKVEILKCFDLQAAINRNTSFGIFANRKRENEPL